MYSRVQRVIESIEATGRINKPAGNGSALVETESPVKACGRVLDREGVSVLAFEHRCASTHGGPDRFP